MLKYFGNVDYIRCKKHLLTASLQVSKEKSYYLQNFPGTALAGEKD